MPERATRVIPRASILSRRGFVRDSSQRGSGYELTRSPFRETTAEPGEMRVVEEPGQVYFGSVVTSTKSSAWKSRGPRASGPGGPMSPLATPNSTFIDVDDRDVLDVPQVAQLLGVGRNTIYTLVAKNQIPHRRLGKAIRFSRAGVMSWLASWSSRDAEERH
jgi:excisionase family DNA binding protein